MFCVLFTIGEGNRGGAEKSVKEKFKSKGHQIVLGMYKNGYNL